MVSFRGGSIGSIEIDGNTLQDPTISGPLKAALMGYAEPIAASMNGDDRGEFRAFEGNDSAKRPHAFVTTYDLHARRTANIDPAIFQRHLGG